MWGLLLGHLKVLSAGLDSQNYKTRITVTIESCQIAQTFSALAHPSRVEVLKALLRQCPAAVSFGRLAADTGIAPSTLTHHLREMQAGGVVRRVAQGKATLISLDLTTLAGSLQTLMAACCAAGFSDTGPKEGA